MNSRWLTGVSIVLVSVAMVSGGCSSTPTAPTSNGTGNSSGGGNPLPPSQPTTATLRVQVDGNCGGVAANIEISIDGLSAGTTQPGSSGISKVVSIGNHTIFGRATNGTTWGTFTVAVPSNGYISNLTCR